MTQYMGEYYWTRTDHDLAILRSKKVNQLNKLRGMVMGYWVKRDIQKLADQISQIDAVMNARKQQYEMFE